jgi:hypothetical protein
MTFIICIVCALFIYLLCGEIINSENSIPSILFALTSIRISIEIRAVIPFFALKGLNPQAISLELPQVYEKESVSDSLRKSGPNAARMEN